MSNMLELHTGQSGEKIVVTLTELTTIDNAHYLFVFTHITTKNQIKFVVGSDESLFPYRYNQFDVDTATLFNNQPPGQYDYVVYEQASPTNTDPAGLNAVEHGKMILYKASEFEYTQYDTPTIYKAYNG